MEITKNMRTEFELIFDPSFFQEIYFADNKGSYFLSATTKRKTITLVVVSILFILCLVLFRNRELLILISSFIFVVCLVDYLNAAFKLWRWKKTVNEYLKVTGTYSKHIISITDNAFSVKQDNEEHIEKWESIKSVDIGPNFLTISGKQNYIIPNRSLSPEDYRQLTELVSEMAK